MSYWIHLCYEGVPAEVPRHAEGGTYQMGGVTEAVLNVTYNYSEHFHAALDSEAGLRWLYGKRGTDTLERLRGAVKSLGTMRSPDYWEPCAGNAGAALYLLLCWAALHPDAVWEGD